MADGRYLYSNPIGLGTTVPEVPFREGAAFTLASPARFDFGRLPSSGNSATAAL